MSGSDLGCRGDAHLSALTENPVRVGIVGLGRAAIAMEEALTTRPGVRLAAFADIDPTALAKASARLLGRACGSLDELLDQAEVEVVYVATPLYAHLEHVLAALVSGRHVVVESPLALSATACDDIAQAAEEHRRHVVGHAASFDPAVLELRRITTEATYGRLNMVATARNGDFACRDRMPHEFGRHRSADLLFNQLPDQIEVVRTIDPTGDLAQLFALAPGAGPNLQPERYVVTARTTSGVTASLACDGSGHLHFDTWFDDFGVYGREQPDDSAEANLQSKFGSLIASYEGAVICRSPTGLVIHVDDHAVERPLSLASIGSAAGALDAIVRAARYDEEPLQNVRWLRATLVACLAAERSARERRAVDPDAL